MSVKRPWGCGLASQASPTRRITIEVDIPDGSANINIQFKMGKVTIMTDGITTTPNCGASDTESSTPRRESPLSTPTKVPASRTVGKEAVKNELCVKKLDFDSPKPSASPKDQKAAGMDKVRDLLRSRLPQHVNQSDVKPPQPKAAMVGRVSNALQGAGAARESSFVPPPPPSKG